MYFIHRIKLYFLLFLLVLCFVFLSADRTKKSYLFLGNHNVPPMIYLEGSKPAGLAVDLAHALAINSGINIKIRVMNWSEAQALVRQGKADALLQINQSEERQKIYDFSQPFLESSFCIFRQNSRADIQNIETLFGETVGVEANGYPKSLLKKYPQINIRIIPNWKTGFELINAGEIDAIIVDRWVGEYELTLHNIQGITTVTPPVERSYSAIAVKKGNSQLLAKINEGLAKIEADGTKANILQRWRKQEIVYLTKEQFQYYLFSLITSILLLLLFLAIVFYARRIKIVNRALSLANEELQHKTKELQIAKEEADAANRAKSIFLANMSHELRTPLNAILGYPQLLQSSSHLSPQDRKYLNTIAKSGEYLLNLINQILDLSKIEAGHMTLNLGSVDLKRILEDINAMLQPKATAKGIMLHIQCDARVPQYLSTDGVKLQQVLVNLLDNAIKFTDRGAVTLAINREETGDRLQFAVIDTGMGMASEELDVLFEAFTQTQSGRQSREGTGLGLAISRQFVHLLGGELTVTSRLGCGSEFRFQIASGGAFCDLPEDRHRAIALAAGQPEYKILVADDNTENREILSKILTQTGFTIREAKDGQDAIAQWQSWQPDLILMDIWMPELNGTEAIQRIKEIDPATSTAIVAVTASTLERERAEVLAAGCDGFLCKPFKIDELLAEIATYLKASYIYEKSPTPIELSSAEPQPSFTLTPDRLAELPPEWLHRLYYAVKAADNRKIQQLLEEIRPDRAAIAEAIAEQIEEFRFDTVLNVLEESI